MTSTARFPSFNWMRGVADDTRISIVHRLVLIRILIYRQNDGRCDPGYQTVADEVGVNRATVFRAVDVAIRRGWLAGFPHSGRINRNFVFTFPQQSQRGDGSTVAPERPLQAPTVAENTSNSRAPAQQQSQAEPEATEPASEIAPTVQRERAKRTGSKSQTHAPADVATLEARKKAPREVKGRREKKAQGADPDVDTAFSEFWAAYPRKVAKLTAEMSYAAAVKRGASAAALIAGAKRYAAERNGQDAKYTKNPSTWLNSGCWQDEPTGTPVIDQHGNLVAYEQPQSQQRQQQRGIAAIAEEMAAEIERNGGGW